MMPARAVSREEFKIGMNREQCRDVDQALDEGKGMACFADDYGVATKLILTWGPRGSDISGPPPASYGGRDLKVFVSPHQSERPMVSPALTNRDVVPQIARPRVSPSRTIHPDEIDMRSRRGNADFLGANRFTPGRQVEEVEQRPMTESEAWWAQRLG